MSTCCFGLTTGNGNIDVLGANLAISGRLVDRCRNHLANLSGSLSSSRIWRWNFDAICHSSRDELISGFGEHGYFRF